MNNQSDPFQTIKFDIGNITQYEWVCENLPDAVFKGRRVVQYSKDDLGEIVPVARYCTGPCSVPRNQYNEVMLSEACLLFGINIVSEP